GRLLLSPLEEMRKEDAQYFGEGMPAVTREIGAQPALPQARRSAIKGGPSRDATPQDESSQSNADKDNRAWLRYAWRSGRSIEPDGERIEVLGSIRPGYRSECAGELHDAVAFVTADNIT